MLTSPSLAPIHTLLGVCFGFAVLFLLHFCQRVYFRFRTSSQEAVDTMQLRILRDGVVLVLGVACAVLSVLLIQLRKEAQGFEALGPGLALRGFEIADASSAGLTLVVHQDFDGLEPRREAIMVSPSQSFSVDVEVIRFCPLLQWLGQGDLARIVEIDASEPKPESIDSLKVGQLEQLFVSARQRLVIVSPADLKRGDLLELNQQPSGQLHFAPKVLK